MARMPLNDDFDNFPNWLESGEYPSKRRFKNAYFDYVSVLIGCDDNWPNDAVGRFLKRKMKYHWADVQNRFCIANVMDSDEREMKPDLTGEEKRLVLAASVEVYQLLGVQYCTDFEKGEPLEIIPDSFITLDMQYMRELFGDDFDEDKLTEDELYELLGGISLGLRHIFRAGENLHEENFEEFFKLWKAKEI